MGSRRRRATMSATVCPLCRLQIDAGRVVAAAMEHHHIALRDPLQRVHHAGEVDPIALLVEVGIGRCRQPGRAEDARVIGPGRVAEPDGLLAQGRCNKVPRHAERTRAAGGLGGHRASPRRWLGGRPPRAVPGWRCRIRADRRWAGSSWSFRCAAAALRLPSPTPAPASGRAHPCRRRRPGLLFSGFGSLRKASVSPRIGSGGAATMVSNMNRESFCVIGCVLRVAC